MVKVIIAEHGRVGGIVDRHAAAPPGCDTVIDLQSSSNLEMRALIIIYRCKTTASATTT